MNTTETARTEAALNGQVEIAKIVNNLERELAAAHAKVEEMRALIDDAAKCFYGPDEQKPGTWGFDVARKLHEFSTATPSQSGVRAE